MSTTSDFTVKFWGVRGSIPCPENSHRRYGGNTSCVEVRCGDHHFIFDAGTGIRSLGQNICSASDKQQIDIFFSHTHHDHIMGMPFFGPNFYPKNKVRLWAGHLLEQKSNLHEILCRYMAEPLFPVPPKIFSANVTFHDFHSGETLEPYPGLKVRTTPLNHPNGATGYRLEYQGKSFCYITDTEHTPGVPDRQILELVQGADCMVYDSSYTDEEYPKFKDWGHSTWQEGVRLCEQADVKQLIAFHHDPCHDDDFLDTEAEKAEKLRPGTLFAKEGLVLSL